jgi:hypothetical protein
VKEERSQSRGRSKEKKRKKEKSRSKSRKSKKRKRSRSSSQKSRRSRSAEKPRNKRSRSVSSKVEKEMFGKWQDEEENDVVEVVRRSASRSASRGPESRSRGPGSRSHSRDPAASKGRRSAGGTVRGSASKSREKSQMQKIEEKSSEEEEEEDDEAIVAKRRLERLKLVSKLKEKKSKEEVTAKERVEAEQEGMKAVVAMAPLWPPPPPPLEAEKIPISYFDHDEKPEDPGPAAEPGRPKAARAGPTVVTVEAELLLVGQRTHITQLGAFAWTSGPAFQPRPFFTYILTELVKERDSLTPAAKVQLMDCLRIKTSNFDVTKSGQKQVVFRHPEQGKVGAVEEREALATFLSFLESVGGPVVLVLHSKDALLPALLGLLTEHGLQGRLSSTVTHVCDLVTLAWGLRLDRLWIGNACPAAWFPDSLHQGRSTPGCGPWRRHCAPTSPGRTAPCPPTGRPP